MTKRIPWFWIALFILLVGLVATLATGWNVVLVRDYYVFKDKLPSIGEAVEAPWVKLLLGTSGFLAALAGIILFFVKLLREMRLNQLQSEFLAAVSHELKTPIATLELTSSLLRAGAATTDEAAKLWDSHMSELSRLKTEVEAMLESARWQSGSVVPNRARVHLETWIEESSPRWKTMLGRDATLKRAGDRLDCEAWVDRRLLNLITDNLIDNARKFSREHPTVILESRRDGDHWTLQVRDEGWGFDPEESERIFDRFFRGRTDAPYAIPGTGLGLYLAASASHAMGLKLSGRSEGRGRGAVFALEGSEIPGGAGHA